MLEIKKITKIYDTGEFKQKALDQVSVNFRESEFASILGPSGSGKTTFLNIIGGLDHYTSGDLIINGISTKKYKDSDWDSYRNHRIGFVFQSYNLIGHQSILSNVKLALTLSGISKKEATDRAKKALVEVGLEKHIYKKPNQLSGGQMQRVAIARALVNNPDILLADEPTGALDSETSIQIMELLKKIAKDKLVIMVTHNPELAREYSSRIIELKDGKIINDSNPFLIKKKDSKKEKEVSKKTGMSFLTALSLSFNNLMTKKGRTVLVAFAGSIGIIGIALILAVSTGFQGYVDSIQEDTLTSYPLMSMQESTDITSALLSMRSGGSSKEDSEVVHEQQYMTSMLSSVKANDLRSFKKYLIDNNKKIEDDVANIQYYYSIDPNIYTMDATEKIAKVNPNNMFSTMMGSNSLMNSYSMMTSVFTQMIDDISEVEDDYEVLKGRWPNNYDEMVIVLSEANNVSDLLLYSLGFRDSKELGDMVTKIMNGEGVNIKHEPLELTYDDLMNVDLRMIMPTDLYKYNDKYGVYEDMSMDEDYMNMLYEKGLKLKIVGIVCAKEGSNSMALNPGVSYTSGLVDYLIDYANSSDIVKKQLSNSKIDVFSGKSFDSKNNDNGINFDNMISIDTDMLNSAFNMSINPNLLSMNTDDMMDEIKASLADDISQEVIGIKDDIYGNFRDFVNDIYNSFENGIDYEEVNKRIEDYLNSDEVKDIIDDMANRYEIASDSIRNVYRQLLEDIFDNFIVEFNEIDDNNSQGDTINDNDNQEDTINDKIDEIKDKILDNYEDNMIINGLSQKIADIVVENIAKSKFMDKLNSMSNDMMNNLASSFNVDTEKIANAVKINMTEEELMRVIGAMMNKTETNAKNNLITLGYQDKDDPTYIGIYFKSFDGKEHFLSFIDEYNDKVSEDKVINYSDTTGILMSSVKTIVNAVSYVLIAFVSISLVVSSIMIGIITYISVYERTKEIGILRSIGASKRNISSIFNAETFIIGLLSGLFGIGISYIFIPIINTVLHHFTGNIPLRAMLGIKDSVVLIILSIILTLIGGLIPARAASRKDPVEALRSE